MPKTVPPAPKTHFEQIPVKVVEKIAVEIDRSKPAAVDTVQPELPRKE
jgi:hypothetical protein